MYFYSSHFTDEKIELQKSLNNLSKITQLVGGRARFLIQSVFLITALCCLFSAASASLYHSPAADNLQLVYKALLSHFVLLNKELSAPGKPHAVSPPPCLCS